MCSNELTEWLELKEKITELTEREHKLRMKLAAKVLKDKDEGSKTAVIDDTKLQATAVLNYTLDRADLDLYQDEMSQDDKDAIVMKPSLNKRAYKKLPNDSILRKCVSVKPGLPQLKVV